LPSKVLLALSAEQSFAIKLENLIVLDIGIFRSKFNQVTAQLQGCEP
jgi:hypothetical protein